MTETQSEPALSETSKDLLRACSENNVEAMLEALHNGADVQAHAENGNYKAKNGMHICAMRRFEEGVVLLRAHGLDINSADGKNGNTSLHLMPNQGNEDMFLLLLEMGADLKARNKQGHSAAAAAQGFDRKSDEWRYAGFIDYIESLPYREDLTELTLEAAFKKDDNDYCLMDNPRMLLRMDELCKALADNATPLTLDAMQQRSDDGRSFMEKAMMCNQMSAVVAALNAQGEAIHLDALMVDGEASELTKTATKWQQVPALFTHENWKGEHPAKLNETIEALPEETQKQVNNLFRLRNRLSEDMRHSNEVMRG